MRPDATNIQIHAMRVPSRPKCRDGRRTSHQSSCLLRRRENATGAAVGNAVGNALGNALGTAVDNALGTAVGTAVEACDRAGRAQHSTHSH
eukprot:CAMPEP_0184225832 /NCGR_PEP_ID=MMETSP0976-20121227/20443_1 /TAXON_ID=483370 /ORGANISM="non described non described, Strain CCMP2097" /LENGTH=90 /DNA_ID=CAMNT_0026530769 /DNA_START=65 /DNA_END=334 /DNA_ORIENTATION=+